MLASEFKVRIEMRQISLRQEASRLGGFGSCGRELVLLYLADRFQEYFNRSSTLSESCRSILPSFRDNADD
jgi:cell fate regulator YaaT (PSP1 superfamily)